MPGVAASSTTGAGAGAGPGRPGRRLRTPTRLAKRSMKLAQVSPARIASAWKRRTSWSSSASDAAVPVGGPSRPSRPTSSRSARSSAAMRPKSWTLARARRFSTGSSASTHHGRFTDRSRSSLSAMTSPRGMFDNGPQSIKQEMHAPSGGEPIPHLGADERRPNASSPRRFLTVMFCDVVGSTHLSRERDVEAYFSILRPYYDACTPVVERHGGRVAQHQGDGIYVWFGYPVPSEDDATRAVRGGLDLLVVLPRLSARLDAEAGER